MNPDIYEVNDDRSGYRGFVVTAAGRRFSVLHTPQRTLVSAKEKDELWPPSNILALDGHVSALACIDIIGRCYVMADKARALGYAKRGSEIRAALGIHQ